MLVRDAYAISLHIVQERVLLGCAAQFSTYSDKYDKIRSLTLVNGVADTYLECGLWAR